MLVQIYVSLEKKQYISTFHFFADGAGTWGLSHIQTPSHIWTPQLRTSPYSDTSPHMEDKKEYRRE